MIPWIVKDIHHYWWLFVRTQHQTTQKTIVRKDSHNKKKRPMKKNHSVSWNRNCCLKKNHVGNSDIGLNHHLPIMTRLFLQEHPDIASALVRVCFSDLSRDELTLVGGDEMLAIRYIGIL